jgi:hypothetical protein
LEEKGKEVYEKPIIRTEEVELNAYGNYGGESPIQQLQPFFGLCCT